MFPLPPAPFSSFLLSPLLSCTTGRSSTPFLQVKLQLFPAIKVRHQTRSSCFPLSFLFCFFLFVASSGLVCCPGRGGELPLLSRRGDPSHGRVHAGTLGVSSRICLWYGVSRCATCSSTVTIKMLYFCMQQGYGFPPLSLPPFPPSPKTAFGTHILLLLSRVKSRHLEPDRPKYVHCLPSACIACWHGMARVAEYLVNEAGANVNAVNHRGDTALSLAAFWGRVRLVDRPFLLS